MGRAAGRCAEDPHPPAALSKARHRSRRRRPRVAAHRTGRRGRRHRRLCRPRHQDHRPHPLAHPRHLSRTAARRRAHGAGGQEAGGPRTQHRQGRQRRRRGRRPHQRRTGARARLRPACRQGQGAARLAGQRKGHQPDRDPRPRHPAGVLAGRAARSRSREARDPARPRGLARHPARHHRSTRRQGSRRRRPRRAGRRSRQHGRLHRPCRHRRRRLLRASRFGARPRRAPARQFGLLPGPRGADAAGADFQRSLLAEAGRGARRARGAPGHRRRWPQAITHVPPRADALGGEAALRASSGRDRRQTRRHHRPVAGADPAAALRRLYAGEARPRRARSARSRSA